jgi:hypothetical protein
MVKSLGEASGGRRRWRRRRRGDGWVRIATGCTALLGFFLIANQLL